MQSCTPADGWRLRPAGFADIPLLRRLADTAFRSTYAPLLSPAQIDYMMEWMYAPEVIERELREGFAWFVAERLADALPAGYLSIERQEADLFHLQKIYLLPEFQGIGLGGWLFRAGVAEIRRMHPAPCRMELNVNRHNRALGFYERMGMRRVHEGDFPIGCGYFMNDYILALDIE